MGKASIRLWIIGQTAYRDINIKFRMKGWHRQEPYDYEGVRGPILFRRLLWRALDGGIVPGMKRVSCCPDTT